MIVTTVSITTFNGSGSTGPFPFDFFFFTNNDLTLTKKTAAGVATVLLLNIDFTVTGAGSSGGGSVALTAALMNGDTLTVQRSTPVVQLVSLPNQGPFYAPTIEQALDRLTMIVQEISILASQPTTVYDDVGGSGKKAVMQTRWMGTDANGNDMWQLEVSTV
jgi:hypothetical protein